MLAGGSHAVGGWVDSKWLDERLLLKEFAFYSTSSQQIGWKLEMKWQNQGGIHGNLAVILNYSAVCGKAISNGKNSRLVFPGRWFEDKPGWRGGHQVDMAIRGNHSFRNETRIQLS